MGLEDLNNNSDDIHDSLWWRDIREVHLEGEWGIVWMATHDGK